VNSTRACFLGYRARMADEVSAPVRAVCALRRHGPGGIARLATDRVRSQLRLDEEHVWCELELSSATRTPFGAADDGLRLTEPSTAEELAPFDGLPTITSAAAWARVGEGGRPWLVLDGSLPAFACWTFTARAPMIAARGGWLALPEGAVVLEDSVAAPIARGRGIAPRTWSHIAGVLATDGVARMLTKVETANAPSRRAVTKAGFTEVAVMRLRRRGPFTRVAVKVIGANATGAELARRLHRRS